MENEIEPKTFNFNEMIKTKEGIEVLSCVMGISIDKLIEIIRKREKGLGYVKKIDSSRDERIS